MSTNIRTPSVTWSRTHPGFEDLVLGPHPFPAEEPLLDEAGHSFQILVVEAEPSRRDQIMAAVRGPAVPAPLETLEHVDMWTLSDNTTIAIFGPDFAEPARLGELGKLLKTHRTLRAIVAAPEVSKSLLHQALREGVSDIVAFPVDALELYEAMERTLAGARRDEGQNVPATPAAAVRPAAQGRLITVMGAKGGAGKSVVATNLAVVLAKIAAGPVCLVDGNFQFPDDAMMLRTPPAFTMADALDAGHDLDVAMVNGMLLRHDSGLRLLAGPKDPVLADVIRGTDIARIVRLLQSFHSHVVVDTPPYFTDACIHLVERSDDVIVVASMDTLNLKNLRLILQTLDRLGVRHEAVRVVINRSNSKAKLDHRDITKVIGREPVGWIPSDVLVTESVNAGMPAVMAKPRSTVARALIELATLFSGVPASP